MAEAWKLIREDESEPDPDKKRRITTEEPTGLGRFLGCDYNQRTVHRKQPDGSTKPGYPTCLPTEVGLQYRKSEAAAEAEKNSSSSSKRECLHI